MFKKIFTNSYLSIVFIILGLLLVLVYQYTTGAKMVYFLPNTNVSIYGITLDTCQQYGSCLYLINSTDIRYVSYIFLLIIIYYAYLSAVAETVLKRGISFFILVVSYILVANAAGSAWFHKCGEFCGLEYVFYWIFPAAVFIAEIINNNSEKTINNTNEKKNSSNYVIVATYSGYFVLFSLVVFILFNVEPIFAIFFLFTSLIILVISLISKLIQRYHKRVNKN